MHAVHCQLRHIYITLDHQHGTDSNIQYCMMRIAYDCLQVYTCSYCVSTATTAANNTDMTVYAYFLVA